MQCYMILCHLKMRKNVYVLIYIYSVFIKSGPSFLHFFPVNSGYHLVSLIFSLVDLLY